MSNPQVRGLAPVDTSSRTGIDIVVPFLFFLAVAAVIVWSLPLLPVDETRYLSVAWEMRLSGDPLLLTINGEPYSHKPPLLFWLVNLAWSIGGVSIGAARVVPVLVSLGVLATTYLLARRLFSTDIEVSRFALPLMMLPAFYIYGCLLMFDQLLTLWVLLSLLMLWRLAEAPTMANRLLLGACLGMGLLAKGPVVLLHVLPPALLLGWWRPVNAPTIATRRWLLGLLLPIAIGAAMILAWAIPAAIRGGPEYAHMIFWGQSAGRMVESFDHDRPFWFYGPVLAGLLAPLLVWPPVWRGLRAMRRESMPRGVRFLLAWMLPSIAAFVMISGKQPHYLLPHLAGFVLIASWLALKGGVRPIDSYIAATLAGLVALGLAFGPMIAMAIRPGTAGRFLSEGLGNFQPIVFLLAGAIAVAVFLAARTLRAQALAIMVGSGILTGAVAAQAAAHVFEFYDLRPVAEVVNRYKDRPIAVFGKYDAEFGFLARLERPVEPIAVEEAMAFFATHPDGIAIWRHPEGMTIPGTEVIADIPYRSHSMFSILKAGGTNAP